MQGLRVLQAKCWIIVQHLQTCMKHKNAKPKVDYITIKHTFISINTTAPILCVIYNPVLDEQYFFHIPYSAFRHLNGNCISISFGKDGHPGSSIWWHYEVESFEELCELAK